MADLNESAATSGTYIRWVASEQLHISEDEFKRYSKLFNTLADIEFTCSHPMDDNRAIDGLDLRDKFEYETGLYLDGGSGLMPKCTMFEMLAALAIRIENQIMRNLSLGDRTSKWFFEMLDNVGLDTFTNKTWEYAYVRRIEDICDRINNRSYKANGEGGLFPLKSRKSIKNEQIWIQCMTYLGEMYNNDDPDLELFR